MPKKYKLPKSSQWFKFAKAFKLSEDELLQFVQILEFDDLRDANRYEPYQMYVQNPETFLQALLLLSKVTNGESPIHIIQMIREFS